jgi:uncharacterized protein (TIGR02246 family)
MDMDSHIAQRAENEQIRALIEGWRHAARAREIEGLLAHHDRDLVAFDCHSQMQLRGLEAFRQHMQACFSSTQGPMTIEVRDLDITAGDRVAFCHYFARCGCTGEEGSEHACWLRVTLGLVRRGDGWSVTHLHCSAPFEPESGRAIVDVPPEAAA